jgi:PhzF family phenazine biosynthesis protein
MRDHRIRTFIVDAFTDTPFKGNPAGVCLVDSPLSDQRMLQIAQELIFLKRLFYHLWSPGGSFAIRYFSPKMEIPLCGHATLASAKVVFSIHKLNEVLFINIQNLDLFAKQSNGQIIMEFPIYETRRADAPPALLDALGIDAIRNSVYNEETKILLLEIADTEMLAGLDPDFVALQRSHDSINGVLVTAPSELDGYDFHSRYFWPWSGTNEDPVTGGTHTFLAKYWAQRLGKTKMRSFQSSNRTGFMDVELVDDQLRIRGQAVIVFEGWLNVQT